MNFNTPPRIYWFTGLSGSGKTTMAEQVRSYAYKRTINEPRMPVLLDGDEFRKTMSADLGFSLSDRSENIRRAGKVCDILLRGGISVVAAFISPLRADRQKLREYLGPAFIEIYCKSPVEICQKRDVKGLYKFAAEGMIKDMTGISSPYEEPIAPDVVLETGIQTVDVSFESLLSQLRAKYTYDR